MQIPKKVTDLTNKVIEKVQEFNKPQTEIDVNIERQKRESNYLNKIYKGSPKRLELQEKRRNIQKRRGLWIKLLAVESTGKLAIYVKRNLLECKL